MTTASTAPVHVHPPKVETFDLDAGVNTDPKGFARPVDDYRIEPAGLYMARPIIDHPTLGYLQSWLLPQLGVRVSEWSPRPGVPREHDYYLDVVRIEPGDRVWRTEDHYLDLLLWDGRQVQVLDTDELLAAVTAGLLDRGAAEQALDVAYRTVAALADRGYRLERWLRDHGVPAPWRNVGRDEN